MNILKRNVSGLLKISFVAPPVRNKGKIIYKPLIPENYPVEYERPFKTPCYTPQKSGDLGFGVDVAPNEFIRYCNNSKELEDADEIVKKMFSVQFHAKRETTRVMVDKVTKKIQRHKYDIRSPEVKIAVATLKINLWQEFMKKYPKNGIVKKQLKELIERRNKSLKNIRKIDYRLYEWLLEKLNLFYRLPLEDVHEQISKKGTIRKLTDELCQKMIQEKLDAYKNELEDEKKVFYKQKLELLKSIQEQERVFDLEPTVTDEDIVEAEERAKNYC